MTRTEIATIHNWTLIRNDYGDEGHDYSIKADGQRLLVNLYVEETPDFKTQRTTYDVSFTPVSKQLTLAEAAEFADLTQKALQAAITFRHLIEIMEEEEEAAEETA